MSHLSRAGLPGLVAALRPYRFLNPVSWNLAALGHVSQNMSLVLVALWMILAGSRAGVLLIRLGQLRALKRSSSPASANLEQFFQELRTGLQVARPVELRVSNTQRAPILIGFLHPVILMPAAEAPPCDSEATEHILRHELAHVRRHDDCTNLAQNCIQAAVFFHPAVWWISKQLSLEREIACDDCVLQQGRGARAYALVLANLAARLSRVPPSLAPGMSSSNSQLKQRINMILNPRRDISPRLSRVRLGLITSAAAIGSFLAICTCPRLVLAQTVPALPGGGYQSAARVGSATVSSDSTPAPTVSGSAATAGADNNTPPGIGSEPKLKGDAGPETPGQPEAAPALPAQPAPPATPAFSDDSRPTTPALPRPPKESTRPVGLQPAPRAPGSPSERSLMERIDRLERSVNLLMDRETVRRASRDVMVQGKGGNEFVMSEKQVAELKRNSAETAARVADQAKRAELGEKRSAEKLSAMVASNQDRARIEMHEAFSAQVQALRKARENLARELERLNAQIERLERDQQRLEERSPRGRTLKSGQINEENREKAEVSIRIEDEAAEESVSAPSPR